MRYGLLAERGGSEGRFGVSVAGLDQYPAAKAVVSCSALSGDNSIDVRIDYVEVCSYFVLMSTTRRTSTHSILRRARFRINLNF
jgi:hypothetical protein